MNTRNLTKILLLTATTALYTASFSSGPAIAAPTVTGKAGCVMAEGKNGSYIERIPGPGGSENQPVQQKCEDGMTGEGTVQLPDGNFTNKGDWINGNFVTADEVNAAFEQAYNELGGSQVDLDPIIAKNNEQDGRLDGIDGKNAEQDSAITNINNNITNINADLSDHEQRITKNEGDITNINNTLGDHQNQLNDHEERITKNEGDIAAIQDGAVFYNRDADGNKTGGVTLNDGTGNPVAIGNVAAGKTETDAVNVGQLTSALDGLGGGATVNPDGTVTGPTYNVGGATYNNVGDALAATNTLSVQYVPDANGKPTNTVALTGDGSGSPVTITNVAAGVNDTDAANYGQVKDNVSYDRNEDGTRGNSITLVGGSTGPVVIHNVADGVAKSDAANVGQVELAKQQSMDYTDQEISSLRDYSNGRFEQLSGEISDTRSEARGGIASAMAAAGLRFDDRPGKGSIAGGVGGFKGATSVAAGVGYTSEDGRWRLNSSVAHSFSTNDTAWNAGASWTFN